MEDNRDCLGPKWRHASFVIPGARLGFRVFGVQGLGFRVFGVQGLGFRVFGVQGLGFRV